MCCLVPGFLLAAALALYILLAFFFNNFVVIFVVTILLSVLVFWIVKNVSGRTREMELEGPYGLIFVARGNCVQSSRMLVFGVDWYMRMQIIGGICFGANRDMKQLGETEKTGVLGLPHLMAALNLCQLASKRGTRSSGVLRNHEKGTVMLSKQLAIIDSNIAEVIAIAYYTAFNAAH
ncbi:hypothetical protein V6N12_018067 [Hibiscus sabdariffa]|uniref:Golgi apparatus membrane protein TVP23 n=1 Tax=Hibiscus sabdariffa TaxID=183260 RepID=A0ABR2APW7_9ROSI